MKTTITHRARSVAVAAVLAVIAVLVPATAAFAATLTLSPASGAPGTEVTVTGVSGTGWGNNAAVTITFDGEEMTTSPTECTTTGGQPGSRGFACSITVPTKAGGSYTVLATDAGGGSGSAEFDVTPTANLSVSLDSSAVAAGKTVAYTAKVYNAGPEEAQNVELAWDLDDALTTIRACPWVDYGSCKFEDDYTTVTVGTGNTFDASLGTVDVNGTRVSTKYKVKAFLPESFEGAALDTSVLATSSTAAPVSGGGNTAPNSNEPVSSEADVRLGAFQSTRNPQPLNKPVNYAIRFESRGPALAENVRLDTSGIDENITNLMYKVSADCSTSASGWIAFEAGDEIPCGDLDGGVFPRVDIKGKVAGTPTSLSTTITVLADNESDADPYTSNNTKTLTVATTS